MFFGSRAHHQVRAASESIQKRDEVRFLLLCEAQAEAYFVEMHSVHKGLRRAVMKVGVTGSEAPKNWPLDFADMVEFAIDQSLAQIGGGLAVVRWCRRNCGSIQFAHGYARQVADIQASKIDI